MQSTTSKPPVGEDLGECQMASGRSAGAGRLACSTTAAIARDAERFTVDKDDRATAAVVIGTAASRLKPLEKRGCP
ncbi:MAG: hypothetical protein RML35_16005 [Chloroherpetonaceae bacterium]|nr:hypothetical protein [Chloroherpetonaceae bacterium]